MPEGILGRGIAEAGAASPKLAGVVDIHPFPSVVYRIARPEEGERGPTWVGLVPLGNAAMDRNPAVFMVRWRSSCGIIRPVYCSSACLPLSTAATSSFIVIIRCGQHQAWPIGSRSTTKYSATALMDVRCNLEAICRRR
jgi:hypothetical protein